VEDNTNSDATPPEGDAAAQQAQAANQNDATSQADDGEGDSSADELKRTRAEAKNYRLKLRELEKKLEERETGDMSELQRAQKSAEDAQTRVSTLETENRGLRVQVAASKAGIVDPEAAAVLLDWDDIAAGDAKALDKALRELVKERPWLAGTARGGGADGGAGRSDNALDSQDMNTLLRGRA
jgi:hypothetical protein